MLKGSLMRAVLCTEFGPPEKLVMRDIPVPKPSKQQVRIKIEACGVNFPDTLIIENDIYFSFVSKTGDCFRLNIHYSKIGKDELNFEEFYSPSECMNSVIQGGRMQKYLQKTNYHL